MDPKVFEHDEARYMKWLADHPNGYVVNARMSRKRDLYCLHCATCHLISVPQPNYAPDQFTGTRYIKVCSESISRLREWGRENLGISDFKSTRGGDGHCRYCNP